MTPSRSKAINTRIQRLSETFFNTHHRRPTVEEINQLYSNEMAEMAKKNTSKKRGNYTLAREDPEAMRTKMSELAKTRWRNRGIQEEKDNQTTA